MFVGQFWHHGDYLLTKVGRKSTWETVPSPGIYPEGHRHVRWAGGGFLLHQLAGGEGEQDFDARSFR